MLNEVRGVINLDLLFNVPCVYFFTLNGEVVYVGRTKNLIERLISHKRTPRKGITFNGVSVIVCHEKEISVIERYMIYRFKPRFNYIPDKLAPYRKKQLEMERIASQIITIEGQGNLPLADPIQTINLEDIGL